MQKQRGGESSSTALPTKAESSTPAVGGNQTTKPLPEGAVLARASGDMFRLSSGDVLSARYRIERYVAAGGMGEVYDATDLELSERVALKIIRPELAADSTVVARFKREIQAARKVTHPNVCRTLELGQHQPTDEVPVAMTFLTMEFLEGQTLAQRIRRNGPMTPEEAAPIADQIASALHAAHEAGVVHRDLKPENVMLVQAKHGIRAVVTDFSIAREIHAAEPVERIDGNADPNVSVLAGTPAYMAPELFNGSAPSPASDLYALGGVLFQMLTGEWNARRPSSLTEAQAAGSIPPPSLRSFSKTIPADWEVIVRRCLDPDPSRRYRSANELLQALRPRRRRTRWLVASAAAVIVAVVAAFGSYSVWFSKRGEAQTVYLSAMQNLRVLENAKAKSLLEAELAKHPSDFRLHYAISLAWLQLGEHTRARAAALQAQKLAERASNEEKQLIQASLIEAEQKDWRKAADIYRSLWNNHPSDENAALRLLRVQAINRDGSAQKTVDAIKQQLPSLAKEPIFLYFEGAAAIANEDYKGIPPKTRAAVDAAKKAGLRALTAYALLDHVTGLRIEGKADESLQLTRETRQMFESLGDRGAAMKALMYVSKAQAIRGQFDEANAGYQIVLEASQEMGDAMARMFVFVRLGELYSSNPKFKEQARRYLAEALQSSRDMGVQNVEVRALSMLIWFHMQHREWDAMDPIGQQLMKVAQQLDSPFYLTNGYRALASKHLEIGEPAAARDLLAKCVTMSARLDEETRIGDLIELALVQNELGEASTAKKLLADAAKLWNPDRAQRLGFQFKLHEATIHLENRDLDRTLAIVDEVEQHLLPTDNVMRAYTAAMRADVARLKKDAKHAGEHAAITLKLVEAEDAAELRDEIHVMVAPALALGQPDRAVSLLQRVSAAAQKQRRKNLAWRVQYALAEIEIARGQRAQAKPRLRTLQQDAERAGFRLLAKKAAALQ